MVKKSVRGRSASGGKAKKVVYKSFRPAYKAHPLFHIIVIVILLSLLGIILYSLPIAKQDSSVSDSTSSLTMRGKEGLTQKCGDLPTTFFVFFFAIHSLWQKFRGNAIPISLVDNQSNLFIMTV